MRSPWELRATMAKMETEILPPDRFTDEGIASLAHDLGGGLRHHFLELQLDYACKRQLHDKVPRHRPLGECGDAGNRL